MTLLQLRSMIAAYLQKSVPDLTINGADLSLLALNNARKTAEMMHDFEFSRKHVTVTIDAMSGGTLDDVIQEGSPTCEVKTVIECGIYDDAFNVHPVEWTTVSESIERQRQIKPGFGPRYPADGEVTTGYYEVGFPRIAFCGNDIWCVPTGIRGQEFDLELEVYTFQQDWTSTSDSVIVEQLTNPTAANGNYWPYGIYNQRPMYINILYGPPVGPLYVIWWNGVDEWRVGAMAEIGQPTLTNYMSMKATTMVPGGAYTPKGTWTATNTAGVAMVEMMPGNDTSDVWLTKGAQYLMWAGIIEINHLAKEFVFRQEGNLPPPEKLADAALENFRQWDSFKYEQDRRHVY
jgi:hypothetical protein